MDTVLLKAFISVAEYQSFSLASEALYITQSAVSKRINQLESQLTTKLFDRHNRSVSLTQEGLRLLPKARQILELIHDTELEIKNTSGEINGHLSMATSHHIGLYRLPPVLKKFAKQYPEVTMDIQFWGGRCCVQRDYATSNRAGYNCARSGNA